LGREKSPKAILQPDDEFLRPEGLAGASAATPDRGPSPRRRIKLEQAKSLACFFRLSMILSMLSYMGMMGVMGDAATALTNAREAFERAARRRG
jgi:hypothetical protein